MHHTSNTVIPETPLKKKEKKNKNMQQSTCILEYSTGGFYRIRLYLLSALLLHRTEDIRNYSTTRLLEMGNS